MPGRRGFQKADAVIPAHKAVGSALPAQINQIGAAAQHHVLRINLLLQRRVQVGVRPAADIGLALQHLHAHTGPGERYGGSQPG